MGVLKKISGSALHVRYGWSLFFVRSLRTLKVFIVLPAIY
jgi:hypothetical protein